MALSLRQAMGAWQRKAQGRQEAKTRTALRTSDIEAFEWRKNYVSMHSLYFGL